MKQIISAIALSVFMVGVASATGVRMTVERIALTQNGYGVAMDSYTKYHVDPIKCETEKKALQEETSVQVGGKQVYTFNRVKCEDPNQTVNQ